MPGFIDDNDPLLRPLIEAESEDERRDAVERLIADHLRPVVTGVLARHARNGHGLYAIDVDDIESSVVLRLIERLQQVSFDESAAIASVRDFAATVAFNATHDVLRRLAPSRARLKNRVRHVLARDSRLATWMSNSGPACSLLPRKGAPVSRLDTAVEVSPPTAGVDLNHAVYAVVRDAFHSVLLDDLVDVLTPVWSESATDSPLELNVAPEQLERVAHRRSLELLWREIRALSCRHRIALLLNLREDKSGNAVALLVMTGIATIDEVADTLEMSTGELAVLWNDLPLDDAAIAARLGLRRQQIINLRRTARERLARRLGEHDRQAFGDRATALLEASAASA